MEEKIVIEPEDYEKYRRKIKIWRDKIESNKWVYKMYTEKFPDSDFVKNFDLDLLRDDITDEQVISAIPEF